MIVYQCALQDMAPYVPLLMPELKAALIDPLPEVRATSAKALGSLLKGMGQQYFEDVLPWLLETLKSEGSSVERSGAAQGLAEVLAVLGPAHVEALLPDILAGTKSKSPFVREGHLTLFKFLPLAIPQTFQVNMLCMFRTKLGQPVCATALVSLIPDYCPHTYSFNNSRCTVAAHIAACSHQQPYSRIALVGVLFYMHCLL